MSTRTIEGAGVALSVTEHGDPEAAVTVLIVHDLAADAQGWAEVARALLQPGGVRVLTYDRRGYGGSTAPAPYGATTVEEQAEDLVAVLDATSAGAVVLLGDGFGALVGLDVMKRHGSRVHGAVLVDPPLFAFAPDASEALSRQRQELDTALRDGGPAAAVEHWLLAEGRAPGDALGRARAAAPAFFADFAGLASWPVTRGELRRLRQPTVIITGPRAEPYVLQAADALAALLPAARREPGGDPVAAVTSLL